MFYNQKYKEFYFEKKCGRKGFELQTYFSQV